MIATRPGTVLRCTLPPLEHLHKRWQALVRVHGSLVPGSRLAAAISTAERVTSSPRPADGASRITQRARQVTRVVTLYLRARSRPSRAARLVGISAHKTEPSRGPARYSRGAVVPRRTTSPHRRRPGRRSSPRQRRLSATSSTRPAPHDADATPSPRTPRRSQHRTRAAAALR